MTAAADRRTDLLHLVSVYHHWRTGDRATRRWADEALRAGMARVGSEWTGSLDIAWFTEELAKVRARPDEYLFGSYERWRRGGLPIWAARAAGMRPTPPAAYRDPPEEPVDFRFLEGEDPEAVIDDLIASNQKIQAAKAVRAAYGVSLREALQHVLARSERLPGRDASRPAGSGFGAAASGSRPWPRPPGTG